MITPIKPVVPLAERPEFRYATATPAERKEIVTQLVLQHREAMKAVVSRLVPAPMQHLPEAMQAGVVGLIHALNKLDVARVENDQFEFWPYSIRFVRDEVRNWVGVGVRWCKIQRGTSEHRIKFREQTRPSRFHKSAETGFPHGSGYGAEDSHDDTSIFRTFISEDAKSVEEMASDNELRVRLAAFLNTLSATDRRILLSSPRSTISRHHSSLIERAKAFVRGLDDDDYSEPNQHRQPLRRNSNTSRP